MFPRRRVNSVVGPPSLSEALHMHLFNNCRNRDHKQRYGTKAFYDLNTTGHQATLANDLQRGDQCIVASVPTRRRVKFDWYRFTREEVRPCDTDHRWRVLFGVPIRSVTLTRTAAINDGLYANFFDKLGRFKQRSVLRI